MSSLVESLVRTLQEMIAPLETGLSDEGSFEQLVGSLGWNLTVSPETMVLVRTGFNLERLFQDVRDIVERMEAGATVDQVAPEAIDAVQLIITSVYTLAEHPPRGLPFPLGEDAFWNEFPAQLIELLLVRYLERHQPISFGALVLFGVIEQELAHPVGAGRVSYVRPALRWERLGRSVTDPVALFRELYKFGVPGQVFDHARLLRALERFFLAMRIPARYVPPRPALAALYYPATNPLHSEVRELAVPLISGVTDDARLEIGFIFLPVPPVADHDQPPDGLYLTPLADGYVGTSIDLGASFSLELRGGFEADGAIGLELHPDSVSLQHHEELVDIDVQAAVVGRPQEPWIVVGGRNSHRIEVGGVKIAVGAHGSITDPELRFELGTGGEGGPLDPKIAIVIQCSEADGFLQRLLGDQPQRLEVGGRLTWSSRTGVAFSGSAGITLVIPLNLNLSVLQILTLTVKLAASTRSGLDVTLAVSASAAIGPVAASVENIGVKMSLVPALPGRAGAFGNLDLAFGFKPPDGLGLSIDAGPVSGGGFLSFDSEQGRYAGIVQLSVASIAITAIGLLDTHLPDGRPGYSFLVIVAVEFTPIQLGMGFTLNGVGGLAGIHRTMVLEALQSGLRNHAIDHIMFPPDPIHNAPQIISDLRTIFPPSEGRYVFGPMVIIGYCSFIEIELGILIELPEPIHIVILGQISAFLPQRRAAVVELHLDVLGIIDFPARHFSLDAVLHDSKILMFILTGEMAMRLFWGDDAMFAMSIGGLHPGFQPPSNFPTLRRLQLALGTGDNPRLNLQCYMALTSNTLQFGAHLELYVEMAGFNVQGWFGFDVLVVFSPFSFRADFSAGLVLRRGQQELAGIHIDATLTGPAPWHAWGTGHVQIVFDISVSFDLTVGESHDERLPPVDPWTQLGPALVEPRNWSGTLPPAAMQVATLSAAEGAHAPVLIDPVGGATLRQRVAPLDRRLEMFGPTQPSGPGHYTIDSVTVGGSPVTWVPVDDQFAPAQFERLSDAEKLSRPSFERMHAGLTLASDAIESGVGFTAALVYESRVVDARFTTRLGADYFPDVSTVLAASRSGASARSPLKTSGNDRYRPPADFSVEVGLPDGSWIIASTDDLTARAEIAAPGPRGLTELVLRSHLARFPANRGRLQVVPLHEVETIR